MVKITNYAEQIKIIRALVLARFGKRVPLRVLHHITERCNFRCKYCETRGDSKLELDTETTKRIMNQFHKLGTTSWSFGGAEALLRNDIGELIDHAKKLHFRVSLVTNGSLVPKKLEELRKVDVFVVSLDGPKKINDYYRGKGSFDIAMSAIKLALKNRMNVNINTTLSNNNMQYIDELVELSKELNVKISFQPIYFGKDKVKDKNSFFEKNNYLKVLDSLIRKKRAGYPIAASESYLKLIRSWPHKAPKEPCYAAKLFFVLMQDGTLLPCGHATSEGVNVTKYGVRKAIKMLPAPRCIGCFSNCYQELNMVFSLKPEAIKNARDNYS
ncbi:MAG: radical SAM protein [bacterium]|nr:radical SAM protein [bacterium]